MPAGADDVCDGEPLTRRELANALADAAGFPRPRLAPGWLTSLGGKTMQLLSRSQCMSNAALKAAAAGWAPRWRSARDGFRAAVRELAERAAGETNRTEARA